MLYIGNDYVALECENETNFGMLIEKQTAISGSYDTSKVTCLNLLILIAYNPFFFSVSIHHC